MSKVLIAKLHEALDETQKVLEWMPMPEDAKEVAKLEIEGFGYRITVEVGLTIGSKDSTTH